MLKEKKRRGIFKTAAKINYIANKNMRVRGHERGGAKFYATQIK